MRITSLELSDFGPHAQRHDHINSSVVGLLGPNGVGKSNWLNAIKFAFTGELVDPMDTYIRGRGIVPEGAKDTPGAAKRAEVTLKFTHHGQDGIITRRITPTSSSRKLVWDREEITRAAEVDAALTDILGADKKALAEIVFPAQGELHKMLFGKQAEREETFLKLLLLTHFAKVSDLADGKSRLLRYEVEDLTSQKEQLIQLLDTQTQLSQEAEADLGRCSTWSIEIGIRSEAQAVRSRLETLRSQLLQTAARRAPLMQELANLATSMRETHLGHALDLAIEGALQNELNEVAAELRTLTIKRDGYLQAYRNGQVRRELETECTLANAALQEIQQEVANLKAAEDQASVDGVDGASVRRDLEILRQINTLTSQVAAQQPQAALQWEVWNTAAQALAALPAQPDRSKEVDELRRTYDQLKLRIELSGKCVGSDVTECPICQTTLTHAIDDKTLNALRLQLQDTEKVMHATQHEIEKSINEYRQLKLTEDREKQKLDLLAEGLETANTALAQLDRPALPSEQLEQHLREANGRTERLRQIEAVRLMEQANRKVFDLTQKIATLPASGVYSETELEACNAAIPPLQDYQTKAAALSSSLEGIKAQIRMIDVQVADTNSEVVIQETKLVEIGARYPARLVELEKAYPDDQVDRIMRDWEERYRTAQGAWEQARKHMQATQDRLNALLAREESDKLRKELASQLSQVKEAFHRRGLPMTYVQYRYQQLLELANRNLNVLDATFVVETDPTQMVSLNFRRTDDDSDALFSMSKLSGGQRVRLSIAFLLAVQQLIIPELGLLVLDEPSTHVNAEGVESLADLLQNLGAQLASADAQIIVCDHDHRLERAFQTTIRLG